VDPTNPVLAPDGTPLSVQRAVAQFRARTGGSLLVTPVNAYSGNNGRNVILDNAQNLYYMAGNAGNGGSPEPINIVSDTGVQLAIPGGPAETTVVGVQQGVPGAAKGFQFGFAVKLLGYPDDKSGKDDNFRGNAIFNNTLFVTKGSGGNGINTVYQVGDSGTLPTIATAPTTKISILPGFSTTLASASSGVMFPFGLFFADLNTLYVADEGPGDGTANANAGLQKWLLNGGVWSLAYTIQLDRGVGYPIPGLPAAVEPAPDGLRSLTGRPNGDGTVTLWAVTSTHSALGDQGADSNQLVTVTDTLSFTTPAQAAGEKFTVLKTAGLGEVLRGVQFVPVSGRLYAEQLVEAALNSLEGLPKADFTSAKARRDLLEDLRKVQEDLEDGRLEAAERGLKEALSDIEAVKDETVEGKVEADLKAALAAIPEPKGDDDDPGHGRRK
jgi:hypothetical protein